MEVAGRLDPALPHAWAGAVLYPGGSYDKPADLSKWDILEIVAKGQGRQYRLVMITGIPGSGDENRTSMPFTLSDRWSRHSFDLDELNPDRKHVRGLLLTASFDSEPVFRFQVDEIVVSRHP